MKTTIKGFALPYLLSFVPGTASRGKMADVRPGRGEAGYTVWHFATAADRAEFMAQYPESRMPCWQRIEANPGL